MNNKNTNESDNNMLLNQLKELDDELEALINDKLSIQAQCYVDATKNTFILEALELQINLIQLEIDKIKHKLYATEHHT